MGLMAITPMIDYSQGNDFDLNLQTIDDLHKPALDGIGYQDLIQEQKVYNMLNRIAVSGGTYRDWLETVYTSRLS